MRIWRAFIIPAALALGVAGSVLTGPGVSAAAGHGASVHVQVVAASSTSCTYYHT